MKIINLTKGMITVVDDEDFEMLNLVKWCASYTCKTFYAYNGKLGYMHKYLIPVRSPYQIDHIDGNSLNNQRSNLRICTSQQNAFNRKKRCNCGSSYKGVSWDKKSKKWESYIYFNNQKTHLGKFVNDEEAAKTYDEYAKKLFGEFAHLNFK